ncbi:MAG: hypothetical protein AAGD04_00480 [Pseudomonadota bacterium]
MTSFKSFSCQLGAKIAPMWKSFGLGAALALAPLTAQAVPLTFDQIIGGTGGTNLLGATANRSTLYFRNVATENGQTLDARVTTTIKDGTDFAEQSNPNAQNYFGDAGYIPDYRNAATGPQDDLGFLYYGNGVNAAENGIAMTLEFFDGTGEASGSFETPMILSDIELAIYDVDGEASQSEYFSVSKSDGLVSYATGLTPQALSVTDLGATLRFDGPGTNFSESDATGAAILYYELTDSLTIDFASVQTSGPSQNAVFSAIDGDLSLISRSDFGDPTLVPAVPLPAGAGLLLSAIAAAFTKPKKHFLHLLKILALLLPKKKKRLVKIGYAHQGNLSMYPYTRDREQLLATTITSRFRYQTPQRARC